MRIAHECSKSKGICMSRTDWADRVPACRTLKGDDKDEQVAKDAQQAFDNSVTWFKKHVKVEG